jgi:hypothetical protein
MTTKSRPTVPPASDPAAPDPRGGAESRHRAGDGVEAVRPIVATVGHGGQRSPGCSAHAPRPTMSVARLPRLAVRTMRQRQPSSAGGPVPRPHGSAMHHGSGRLAAGDDMGPLSTGIPGRLSPSPKLPTCPLRPCPTGLCPAPDTPDGRCRGRPPVGLHAPRGRKRRVNGRAGEEYLRIDPAVPDRATHPGSPHMSERWPFGSPRLAGHSQGPLTNDKVHVELYVRG